MNKNAPETEAQGKKRHAANNTKLRRILGHLLHGSLNRFEAEPLGDHCLHTTVSSIQKRGVPIARHFEEVPTRFGTTTRVCRYWVAVSDREKARALLGYRP